jgi:hypothetical protein
MVAALTLFGLACSSSTAASTAGRWTAVSSLSAPREGGGTGLGNAAVRLADGTVLFAGGYHSLSGKFTQDPSFFLRSAEIFNPSSGTWKRAPAMNQPRFAADLVLLPSGKVLAGGGTAGDNAVITPSAEIYDPHAGTWSFVDEMSTCRVSASASVLASGDVLVAGGTGCDGKALASAEIFHPATGSWSRAASMSQARWGHSATTLADGRILVTGGRATPVGMQPERVLASAEIYDPAREAWSTAASMHVGRVLHASVRLSSGLVLVAGGHIQDPSDLHAATAAAELYDPRTDSWSATTSMNAGREEGGAVLLDDGTFLMAGGGQQASAEIYHPSTRTWTLTGAMRTIHDDPALVKLGDGTVLIAGGFTLGGTSYHNTATAEVFHPPS